MVKKTNRRSGEFSKSRQIMSKHLKEDRGLYLGYQANIAMFLHDHHGITDLKKRNSAAKGILSLIFFNR